MPASERTWYRLICYTFCTCLWVFSFQVVLAVVFVLNLLVAFCTGNFHNVLTRVVRTAWQVELWIHSIYITDTKLPLPRADAIKRGTIWWTLLYFFVWKQIQTAYFASIGASIITNSSADQSAPSVPTSTVTSIPWPEIGLPFPLTTKPSTSSSSTGDESAAKVLIVVVVAFTINIFMVWISTWMTQSYYLWLIRDLELAESRQLLPRSEKKPFSPRSVSDDMESPPPSLPLGQHTSSVGSSHSTSSGYNRPISMPPMPPMPLMPPMGPVLPPLDPDQANKSIHPMLHFPSTLTERNGVLGFPVPPPPPVEGVAPSFWNSWLETPPTLAEKSTPKKDHHHKTHKHKGDPSMVDGKHHVHALRHLISLRKPGGLEEAKLHLEALQRELSRHTDVHDPRRRHLENLCRDFADELHTWESELDVAVTVQREKAKQDDATMDIARDRLQTLERLWETSDESARDDTLIEHLRNQLLALRAMVSSVPPTRQDRQIFDRHCDALSDNVARFVALQQEKAAWKAHEEEVERRKTAREGIQTQLNAMRQTLAVAVVLSADQKGSLEAICVDLERQLAELAEPLSPPPPTSTVATQPVLQSESIRVKEDRTFGESLVVFGGRPPASKETRRPVAEIVHTAPTDEFNEEDVLHAPKESRFLDVTLKAQSGWLSPSGYAQVPASYGLLSPVASAAASIATYGILSPLSSPKARDFDVAPTYRALDAPVKQDNVHFLAFAPPTVCHGMTFQFDIWAFLVNQRQEMLEQATSTNPSGRSLSREMLLQIRRGALIHVQLEVPSGFALKSEPTQALEWQGDVSSVAYDVQCTKKASTGQVLFKATIIVGSSVLILRSYLFVAANVDKDALSVQELTCELEALPKTFTEIPFNSLQLGGMVGRGNYGEAFRATYHGKEVLAPLLSMSLTLLLSRWW
ncbi:hypothetical protein AC1031_019549 [Aphanomyces cochlioides]|nr:hypothetical protein AC1031_019549 [Aphanomyces cochlioides]